MSLIESALQRLRRSSEAERQGAPEAPRHVSAHKTTSVVMPTFPVDYELKQIKLDTTELRRTGYLPEVGLERRFADHYRQIKRPLIEKALSGSPEMRLIMISSALPGDGKTFTSINLALSMAREADVSALLVDADAPKAQISEVFGLRRERGLLDALADEAVDVESLVVRTDVRGLEILPAGRFTEQATELLASVRMEQAVARLNARSPRRLIIFDSAPLLVSSEARVLVRLVGQVVLVVRVRKTPRHAALDAASRIDKGKLQGLVFNHTTFRSGDDYYGYADYGSQGTEAGRQI